MTPSNRSPQAAHPEALEGPEAVEERIDLYVVAERNVFDTDTAWLDALTRLAALDTPGLALQVRTKTETPERALELACLAREVTADACRPVLLNGSLETATDLAYDGAHWPEALIPESPRNVENRTDSESPLSSRGEGVGGGVNAASVHSPEAARRAEAAGADFVVAGTIFDAGSKPAPGEGIAKLQRIAEATRLPVLAIGGITPARVAECIAAGASGVAVVTYVLHAPDIARAILDLREALDEAYGAAKTTLISPRTSTPSPPEGRGQGEGF